MKTTLQNVGNAGKKQKKDVRVAKWNGIAQGSAKLHAGNIIKKYAMSCLLWSVKGEKREKERASLFKHYDSHPNVGWALQESKY